MGDGVSAPQHEGRSIDLSGSQWREARARTAIPNTVASHGLNPSSGQLAGPGDDRLDLTILCPQPHARAAFPAPAAIGERGPLLAVLDWAQRRGVKTSPARDALSRNDAARPIAPRAFQQIIVDVQHECTTSGETAWGLFPSDQAGRLSTPLQKPSSIYPRLHGRRPHAS